MSPRHASRQASTHAALGRTDLKRDLACSQFQCASNPDADRLCGNGLNVLIKSSKYLVVMVHQERNTTILIS